MSINAVMKILQTTTDKTCTGPGMCVMGRFWTTSIPTTGMNSHVKLNLDLEAFVENS